MKNYIKILLPIISFLFNLDIYAQYILDQEKNVKELEGISEIYV